MTARTWKTALVVCLICACGAAIADNVIVIQDDEFGKALREQRARDQAALDRSFHNLFASINARKTVVNAVLVINCQRARNLIRTFGDGHIEQTDMGGNKVTALDIATIQATYPTLKIVTGCDE